MQKNTKHGFSILKRMNDLKHDFDAAGYRGWESFIRASILSGIVYPSTIVDEAIAISGNHLESQFSLLIGEAENELWHKSPDGRLSVSGR